MLGHRPLNLEDYVSIVKRRGWIVLIPLILLPILTYAISYTIAPLYQSQTLVLVEGQKVPDNLVKPVISADLDSRLASMKEQILSRSSIEPIIDRYSLYADKKTTMDDRIDMARRSIEIKTISSEVAHSGLPGFFISFKARDPHTAQQVCSEITSLFVSENLRSRSDSAEGTVDFLRSQLSDAKRNLDEQDAKMAAFQEKFVGRLPGQAAENGNMLSSLNTQLEAANQSLARMQQDKTFAESMLAQQTAAQSAIVLPGGTVAAPTQEDLQSLLSQRADLLTHYTPDYPDVVALDRRIAEARRSASMRSSSVSRSTLSAPSRLDSPAVQQLRAQIQSANIGIEAKRREQAQIQTGIGSYQSRIQSSPQVEQQYKQLTRDYQTAQAFYDDLLNKMNTSKMATDLEKRQQGEQFRVMDAANLPDAPISPKRSVFLIGGLAGGLALGLVMIAVLEFKDTAIRSERDIWAFTELPTLTVISLAEGVPQPKTRGWVGRLFLRKVRTTPAQAGIDG